MVVAAFICSNRDSKFLHLDNCRHGISLATLLGLPEENLSEGSRVVAIQQLLL